MLYTYATLFLIFYSERYAEPYMPPDAAARHAARLSLMITPDFAIRCYLLRFLRHCARLRLSHAATAMRHRRYADVFSLLADTFRY